MSQYPTLIAWEGSLSCNSDISQHSLYLREARGLREVVIESCFFGSHHVVLLSIARQCDEHGGRIDPAKFLRDLIPIHVGKSDIKEHYLGIFHRYPMQRVFAVIGDGNLMTSKSKELTEALRRLDVVIDDQYLECVRDRAR